MTAATSAPFVPELVASATRKRSLRSAGAVLAGIATVAVLSSAGDALCHTAGVYPSGGGVMATSSYLLATAYRAGFQVLGGYVTARLAPARPARHVTILALIGFALAALGVVAAVASGPALGPLWYPLALVALSLPTVWLGGTLANNRTQK